jgi:hypothetical protein
MEVRVHFQIKARTSAEVQSGPCLFHKIPGFVRGEGRKNVN